MGIFKTMKNQKGLSMIEILVAVSIFFVLFTAVASTYALGINLQYRSELGTAAEFIAQFLLEYYISVGPYNIVTEPSDAPYPYITDNEGIFVRMVANLPPPAGSYEFLDQSGGNSTISAIYTNAKNKNPPTFVDRRYYKSEPAPHPKYFPYIFMIDGFKNLPPDTTLEDLNNIFSSPKTKIRFEYVDEKDYYQIVINSFPPFFIAQSPELKYWIEVKETTYPQELVAPPIQNMIYEITINVEWQIKGAAEKSYYIIKGLVPNAW